MTKVCAESYATKSVNRLNYGIYFQHLDTVSVLSDYFLTNVKIPLPHTVQLSNTASRDLVVNIVHRVIDHNSHVTSIYNFGEYISKYMKTLKVGYGHYLIR